MGGRGMTYWFASHVRRGAAASVTAADADGRAVATIALHADVTERDGASRGVDHTQTLTLYGPGDVASIDPAQILRTTPVPGDPDAEPNYLASVELAHPDLPW